ncbi:MAG: hypothetical protein ACLQJR_11770 [Stellaceae bacterium]
MDSSTSQPAALNLDRIAYPISEWARLTSTSRSHLYAEAAAGRLRMRKVGGKTLILTSDGLAWLRGEPVQ